MKNEKLKDNKVVNAPFFLPNSAHISYSRNGFSTDKLAGWKNLLSFWKISFLLLLFISSCQSEPNTEVVRNTKKILLISNPKSIQNTSETNILEQLTQLSDEGQFELDTSLTFSLLSEDTLQTYSAVILLNIEEDDAKVWEKADLERYVQAGNGIFILEDEQLTSFAWNWYKRTMDISAVSEDETLPNIPGLINSNFEGGRISKLKDASSISKENLSFIIEYLIGNNTYDYANAITPRAPNFNRFSKVVLDDDIYEPMEMVVLPDLKVLFLERRGKIKLHDPYLKRTITIAEFDVCTDGNYEDGLQGIALDPKYGKDNHWVYIYYSPSTQCDIPDQYLSRFTFKDDSLHWSTEKVVLKVGVQREECCHSGGSVEFGPDGVLYLSTGDNTSSKESDGMTPTDERPGRGPFDAQKSSSNTHDLRGKILRIRPEADGSYSIPDGNLFPKDGSKGRPEIYAMGCRNPFRITIDKETGWLFWGDVGPDGGETNRYGTESFDEWNLAKEAGNFGWPYFTANNIGYPDRNFETDEVSTPQNPENPINDSPNNYGSKELPPAQPAWIWYPYGESEDFPLLGKGSRSSMAGPFYYSDDLLPLTKVKFPAYYEGKMFIYEWARSWIKVLTMDKKTGELLQMEPFLPDVIISKPIELEFGPDGALYILEYGRQYFMNNPDATLSRIEFTRGNRPPIAQLSVENPNGNAPHTVHFSAEGSYDFDEKDSLTFEWYFTNTETVQATGKKIDFTFENTGIFHPILKVIDKKGAISKRETEVKIGNAPPKVELVYEGNRSFLFDQNQTDYEVKISDLEDEKNNQIDTDRILVNASYVPDNEYLNNLAKEKTELPNGPLQYVDGIRLIKESDCLSCHNEDAKNIGPSYREVAKKYKGQPEMIPTLARKIVKGGGGVWGGKLMAGHPQLSQADAESMVRYILSLEEFERLPPKGKFDIKNQKTGGYVLSAAYKDFGANGIEPITSRDLIILRPPTLEAEDYDEMFDGIEGGFGDNVEFIQVYLKGNGWLRFDNIDLKGITSIQFKIQHQKEGQIVVRSGSLEGDILASAKVSKSTAKSGWNTISAKVNQGGIHNLYVIFEAEPEVIYNKAGEAWRVDLWQVDWLKFEK